MGTPVNLLLSSQKCQGVPFSPSVKLSYFCSGPVSVDPICPQPKVSALTEMSLIPKEAKYVINAFLQQDSVGNHLSNTTCLTQVSSKVANNVAKYDDL